MQYINQDNIGIKPIECTSNEESRLRELAKADKDGRVVVLPCKVSDIMYRIFKERTKCSEYGEEFDEYLCSGCECECDSTIQYVIRQIQPNTLSELVRYIDDIGKTVFSTREEVERAIQEMGGKA